MTAWHAIKPDLVGRLWKPTPRQAVAIRTMALNRNRPIPMWIAFNGRRSQEGFGSTMQTLIRRGMVEYYTTVRGEYKAHDMPVFRLTPAGMAAAVQLRLNERQIEMQSEQRRA